MLKIITIFLVNLSFTNYFLQLFSNRENAIVYNGLQQISNDLNAISFPGNVVISLVTIAFIIAGMSTLLSYFTVLKSADINNLENILFSFIKLFFINSFSCLSVFYLLRIYNLPRSLVLLNIATYPFIMALIIFVIKYFDFNKFLGKKYLGVGISVSLMTFFYILFESK